MVLVPAPVVALALTAEEVVLALVLALVVVVALGLVPEEGEAVVVVALVVALELGTILIPVPLPLPFVAAVVTPAVVALLFLRDPSRVEVVSEPFAVVVFILLDFWLRVLPAVAVAVVAVVFVVERA